MSSFLVNPPLVTEAMLKEIDADWTSLFKAVPSDVRCPEDFSSAGKSEIEVKREITDLAAENRVFKSCFLGAGSYRHFIPAVVEALASREEFVTAYTPYQPEMSQGILQAIFEYQTMICLLTGLDVSNASVYDGATACAEAVNMCREKNKKTMLVAASLNPRYKKTIKTYFQFSDIEIKEIPVKDGVIDQNELSTLLNETVTGVLIQSPNYFGNFEDGRTLGEMIRENKSTFVLCANPLSFALSASAKEIGADICVGEAQPLGLKTAYGGPYLGYMTCSEKYMRKLPGRIVGQTTDKNGKTAYVLTLQAREQHIRREKASSSICSNQANCALRCAIFLAAVGPQGLKMMAEQSYQKAHFLADKLTALPGFTLAYKQPFFNEFVSHSTTASDKIITKLLANDILPGFKLNEHEILWCATECNTEEEINRVAELVKEVS